MKLTKEQLKQFDEDGYLFFPNYFSPEETAILKTEIPGVFQQRIDLDDIGAPIGQLPHAGRPGAHTGQVEHGEAGQGLRGVRDRHQRLRLTFWQTVS